MADEHSNRALREIHRLFDAGGVAGLTDEQLRERFVRSGDARAFEALVTRHGRMVLSVCRGVLRNQADAEDAFQATFLILVRKAHSLRADDRLASWLYRVAYRVATRANVVAARRRSRETKEGVRMWSARAREPVLEHDVAPLVYEEVNNLPQKYRDPVVLCYLEGLTYEEAGTQLHWPTGTVAGRLAKARELLRVRLTRRGVVLSSGALAAMLAPAASAHVVPAWIQRAVDVAESVCHGQALAAGAISASAVALSEGVLRTTLATKAVIAPVIVAVVVAATFLPALAPIRGRGERVRTAQVNGADAAVLTFAVPANDLVARMGPAEQARLERVGNEFWLPINSVAYSPDGRLLATAVEGQKVVVREVSTKKVTAILKGHTSAVTCVAFSPDGKTLATSSRDQTVRLWDASDGQEREALRGHAGEIFAVAFCPDGKTLASAGDDRVVRLWDPVSARDVGTLPGHTASVRALAFSHDGTSLASAGVDRGVRLWDVSTRAPRGVLTGHSGAIRALAFAPDGQTLASGGDDNAITLWDVAHTRQPKTLRGHNDAVTCLAFAPGGRALASGSADATIMLWDPKTGEQTFTFRGPNPFGLDDVNGHADAVTALAFAPSGRQLASGGSDRAVKLWNTFDSVITADVTLEAHQGNAWFAVFSPDGALLLTGGDDHLVKLWDADSASPLATLEGHERSVVHACFSPDGRTAMTASADGTVRFWDIAARQPAGSLIVEPAHDAIFIPPHLDRRPGFASALSPDGSTLATAGTDRAIRLWDVATRRPLRVLAADVPLSNDLVFSPDGTTLAAAQGHPLDEVTDSHVITVWDVATGKPVATLAGHRAAIWMAPFSPNGRLLASPSSDGLTKLWDTATWTNRGTLVSPSSWVQCAAFSPDGKSLAVGHGNGTVTWWDAVTMQARARLVGHNAAVRGVSFSPRGNRVASASGDGTVRLWRTD